MKALRLNFEFTGMLCGRTWPCLGASWAQFGASWAPLGLNLELHGRLLGATLEPLARLLGSTWEFLGIPSRTPSATWLLGATWPSKPHFQCNLAPLRLICGALATLRVELSPARELDFQVLATWKLLRSTSSVQGRFGVALGHAWAPLGLNLEPLGRLLGSAWSLMAAS